MARLMDWRPRLTEYLLDCGQTVFAYGDQDCALFAAGAVAAMTGCDPAKDWRGRYRTLNGGLRLMRAAGYRDHIDMVNRNFASVHPAFAGDGDLASVVTPEGDAMGVIMGEVIYLTGPAGAAMKPRTAATMAWVV